MKFESFDNEQNGEHNGLGFLEIFNISVTQVKFYIEAIPYSIQYIAVHLMTRGVGGGMGSIVLDYSMEGSSSYLQLISTHTCPEY